jgi:hypothetical protein
MSEISDLYNKDLEIDASATSEEINLQINLPLGKKSLSPFKDPGKPSQVKPKKIGARQIVKKNKNLSKCFKTLEQTNSCFADVISTVMCYRPELGLTLEKINAAYNKLFEVALECTISVISNKETEMLLIEKKHQKTLDNQIEAKEDIQSQLEKQKELINVLKTRLKIANTSEEALIYEIKQLRDILKYDQTSTDTFRNNLEKAKDDDDLNENHEAKNTNEDLGLKIKLDELEKVIKEIENGHQGNSNTLKEMHGVIRSMAKSSTTKANWTQTEEGELYWNLDPGSIIQVCSNPASYYYLIKDVEGNSLNLTRPKPTDSLKWSLTPTIMRFLANSPSRMALPYPYAYFKKLLMEICTERLIINPEVSGYMQPLLPLDEFLCIFFLKKHQLRRLAEIKLKEFLGSLKFYMKWQRVFMFSKVSGIAVDILDNNDYLYTDYHTQMYFIFCLGVLTSDSASVWEAPEGHTWLKSGKEESLTLQAMPWIGKNDLRRVRKDVSYMCRTINDSTGTEGEFVDVDQLITYYMKEYISLRQDNINKLSKNFTKTDQVHQGLYNYDEFKFLLPINEDQPIPESIISRAFYYSLVAGTNTFEINSNSFVASCIRFGIENPCSLVQVGWDLIFPFPLIKYMVDNKEEKYSGIVFKKEKGFVERNNYLKVPNKLNTPVKLETQGNSVNLEKIAALLAQHYGVIRELKKFSEQFRIFDAQNGDLKAFKASFEKFYNVLNTACEFFTFPIIF